MAKAHSLSARKALFATAIFSFLPLLVACPKKEEHVVVDAAPPPPEVDATPVNLAPLDEADAADAADTAPPKKLGPGVPTNVVRLKQCCAALRSQAKSLGASPESGMILGAAAQCDALAAAAGPSGNAPELGSLKALLAGKTIPPVCQGF